MPSRALYAMLFHPEVVHTERGLEILRNFAYGVCGCTGDWTMASFVEEATARIRDAGRRRARRVRLERRRRFDGGRARSFTARSATQLTCIFVDNGVLRLDEAVADPASGSSACTCRSCSSTPPTCFCDRLAGVIDPEQKRKIIGATFIDVFEAEAAKLGRVDFLAQGTLYPDVIESIAIVGQSSMIKSHHNVGGLPERMRMKLVEPLRELFKDEVRDVGRKLGARRRVRGPPAVSRAGPRGAHPRAR